MDVSLPLDLEQFVHEKVRSGLYPSASEVIGESLRLLKERDEVDRRKLEELRKEISIGIDQADRFPETGQAREELAAGLRSFPVAPYVVFFRPSADTIEVLRVLHGRRDLRRNMRGRG